MNNADVAEHLKTELFKNPIIKKQKTDLPEPESPKIPMISPELIFKKADFNICFLFIEMSRLFISIFKFNYI